jgi:two-component system, OmpR family, response regulator BaeR
MTARILIVEDESELAAIVADYARAAGYDADVIGDGRAALAAIERRVPDLIVLDLQLPGLDGLSLCTAVRAFSDVPIIMVTARVEEVDRLLGLEIGADDYVCKPFSPRELVARIKVILRRPRKPDDSAGLIAIDEPTRTIRVRSEPLTLTPSEYALLAAMAKRPGTIYSRAQLLDLACRDSLDVGDRAIDTHIKNLRRKLAVVLPDVDVIHSVYGLGYRVEL